MPLPEEARQWPPPEHAAVFERMRVYDAWYSGDPDRLAAVYTSTRRTVPANRPSQYRGGIVGTLARWFWGQPTPAGERRTKLHLPLPADIATASADLLFAEPPTFTFTDPATMARWEELADEAGLAAVLSEAAEVAAPLGGVYLRAGWDREVADHPIPYAVHADRALPEWGIDGQLRAVTFWHELDQDGQTVWRLVERHEYTSTGAGRRAVTLYGLYRGTEQELGHRVDLAAHPDTAGYEPVIDVGLPILPVVYVPNMRPSRVDRGTLLGRSDYEGVESLFDALDETLTSWMRDIRLAKGRVIVPSAWLESLGPGQGAAWDPEREAYEALNIPPTAPTAGLTVQQFAIRVAEHEATITRLMRQAVEAAGYSAHTFGLGEAAAATATEIHARERRSYLTRGKKISYWRPALARLAEAMLWVDRLVFQRPVAPGRPVIEWPDGAAEQPLTLAQTLRELHTAGAVSTWAKVAMLHPDWTDGQIAEEVDRILAEQGAGMVDPVELVRRAAATGELDTGGQVDEEPDPVDGEEPDAV